MIPPTGRRGCPAQADGWSRPRVLAEGVVATAVIKASDMMLAV